MAERKIGWDTLVKRVDPKQQQQKKVDYIFGGRIVKRQTETRPGKPYRWL